MYEFGRPSEFASHSLCSQRIFHENALLAITALNNFSQPSSANPASRKKLESVFGGADDDDALGVVPKRKLVKLDDEETSKEESDEAEDKKRTIKSLIERIPTAKDELFAYSLDWSEVDQVSFHSFSL